MELTYLSDSVIDKFIKNAFLEDVGAGDHSSLATISEDEMKSARLIVKDKGIIAGIGLAKKIFEKADKSLSMDFFLKDGDLVQHGDIAFHVTGHARSILTAERLVLNCMQRMSGIATLVNEYVKKLDGTSAKLLDTRKTTPNFRAMEKWAVAIGGGQNHRFGLYDMIILKDNHVDYAGGIIPAIDKTRSYLDVHHLSLKIEIETRTLEEVEEVLKRGGVDRIMLDNMQPDVLAQAVRLIQGRYETEASGGINLDNVREIALTGVDFVSVGALTHSAKSLDMSLKAFKIFK